MRYKCCKSALNYFMITTNALAFCNRLAEDKNAFWENYNGETGFTELYINERKKYIENCKRGINIPKKCINCYRFREDEWDETFGIDKIGVAVRLKCSCNCVYCVLSDGDNEKKRELNTKEVWDIRPVLEELENNKLLKETGTLLIAGGEVTESPKEEVEWFINYAKRNNFSIEFASSGMFYSKEIEEALKNWKTILVISPDSGTKETYEKVKRVNYHEKVWDNLRNYVKVSQDNPSSWVAAKYIILDGLNDNIEEFNAFLQKCNEINCKHINVSVELNWLFKDGGKKIEFRPKTMELIQYIKSLNDKRIYSDVFYEFDEKITSAREYIKEIENALLNDNIFLTIVVFSGTAETYERIAKKNYYNDIWNNIALYKEAYDKRESAYSKLQLQYKLILGQNDDIKELEAFVQKCTELNIDTIQIDISDSKVCDLKYDKENLSKIVDYFNKIKDKKIVYSSKINKILEE